MSNDNGDKYIGRYNHVKDTKNYSVFKVSTKTKNPAVLKIYVTKEFAADFKKMKLRLIPVK